MYTTVNFSLQLRENVPTISYHPKEHGYYKITRYICSKEGISIPNHFLLSLAKKVRKDFKNFLTLGKIQVDPLQVQVAEKRYGTALMTF